MSDLYVGSAIDEAPSSRAFTSDELRGLAGMLDEMPAPTEFQPHEITLNAPAPGGIECFGRILWWAEHSRWVFASEEITLPDEDAVDWEPAPGQELPTASRLKP